MNYFSHGRHPSPYDSSARICDEAKTPFTSLKNKFPLKTKTLSYPSIRSTLRCGYNVAGKACRGPFPADL
jgi:hypothetical protein